MTDTELKMRCLELAVESGKCCAWKRESIKEAAQLYYNFIKATGAQTNKEAPVVNQVS